MYIHLELKELLLEKGYHIGYAYDAHNNPYECIQLVMSNNRILYVDLDILSLSPEEFLIRLQWYEENLCRKSHVNS